MPTITRKKTKEKASHRLTKSLPHSRALRRAVRHIARCPKPMAPTGAA
jgi:hypothetical protein